MTRCLRDRALWLVHEGVGRVEDHAHLRTCPGCASRYGRLARDLEKIGVALRLAPAEALRTPARGAGRRWMAAAALVAALGLGAVGIWQWRTMSSPPPVRPDLADALPFLGEVAVVLSGTGDAGGVGLVDPSGMPAAWPDEAVDRLALSSGESLGPLFLVEPLPDDDGEDESAAEPETGGDV